MQSSFEFGQLYKQLVFAEVKRFSELKIKSDKKLKAQYPKGFQKICKFILQNGKRQIFQIILQSQQKVKESLARLLVNKFLMLNKSFSQILEEGILTLYIQMFEIKQNLIKNGRRQSERQMLTSMIEAIQPLLFQHFIFKEYQRRKKIFLQIENTQSKTKPLLKKISKTSEQSAQQSEGQNQELGLRAQDESLIQIIKQEFKDKCLHDLLSQYLQSETQDMNEMVELCRICSRNVRLGELQKHVAYCQKRIVLKQQINKYSKKLQQTFQQIKNIQKEIKFSDLDISEESRWMKTVLGKFTNFHKQFDKKKKEKHWQSMYKIRQTRESEYVGQIEEDITAYEMQYGPSNIIQLINIYLVLQRDMALLCRNLSQLEQKYKSTKQIKSTTTLRQRSQCSNNKNEKPQKKSKFAQFKVSNNSINSIHIQRFGSKQNQPSDRSFQILHLDGFGSTLRTKKSLGTPKNVQFNFQECDKIKSQSDQMHEEGSKKFKSLYNFQSILKFDDSQDSQSQHKQMSQLSLEGKNSVILDFQIIKYIGKGAFGKVYAARRKSTNDIYALKIVNIDQKWGQKQLSSIINEHQVFKKIQGDHLVRAPFSFSQGSTQIFMMEFMPGGDLGKLLQDQCYFQQSKAKFYLAEIVLAIQHLHKAQIIHRDLKPQNLVLDQGGHLKLTDFGLSQFQMKGKLQKVLKDCSAQQFKVARRRQRRTAVFQNRNTMKLIGTPDYIAPQIINGVSIDNKSIDWWSLGVIAYELMVGVRPFCGNSIQEVVNNIIRYQIQWPEIGNQEGCISQNAYNFIQSLLSRDFVNRLGAQDVNQIKSHPFFEGIDWQNIKYTKAPYIPPQKMIGQLLQMPEDTILRQQIELMIRANNKNSRLKLENFVRYDILGQQTVDSAKKSHSMKGHTLKKLENIKQSINNETFSNEIDVMHGVVRKTKKHRSYYQVHSRQNITD